MSLTSQNLLTNSPSRLSFYFTKFPQLKNPNPSFSSPFAHFTNHPHFLLLKSQSTNRYTFRSFSSPLGGAFDSDGTVEKRGRVSNFNLDAFLSLAEFVCLASSVVIAIGFAVNSAFSSSQKPVFARLGNGVSGWHLVLLVGAVVAGAMIRWRQWSRICKDISKPGVSGVNLVGRIEKLEEDLRSSATIIRVLSRQLEKLGIRFRVTRKALKEPIGETAALAQKNSEATRALAAQEDILEKELGEIQKVLLAMQDQQQKQLDLILAIGKNGKLWEEKREDSSNSPMDGVNHTPSKQVKTSKEVKTPKKVKTLTVKEDGNSDFGLGI